MALEWKAIRTDRGDHGVRIDRVLLRHLRDEKGISRNRIQKWIDGGDVLINGAAPPRAAWRIQSGDELQVRVRAIPARTKPAPESQLLEVLYEDDDLIAINKPAGQVVHPSYRNTTGTLMNGLLALAEDWPKGSTPALLGRLDKLTSGIVLVTKRSAVHAALQRSMAANRVDKDYLAIVYGKPSPLRGTIDLALDRDPWDRRRVTVTDRGGQRSVTKYERLATTGSFSTVRCRLITGRTHQIRVHLAAKRWPIVGDPTYGSSSMRLKPDAAFPRQALHAWRLTFRQPTTGKELSIEAPIPGDMRALAAELDVLKDEDSSGLSELFNALQDVSRRGAAQDNAALARRSRLAHNRSSEAEPR
jgi:23S rRNA pseudouridine1911/1915/1917 synthase